MFENKGESQGQACTPFAQNESILYVYSTKLNQVALCIRKFSERSVIPKIAIHSGVNPFPGLCTCIFHFISFQSLASVTHGHGTQSLYWRCAKQKDRAKIFHCFKLENKASSSSAPPTTSVASLYTLDPQEFFGRPRHCGCSTIRGRRV